MIKRLYRTLFGGGKIHLPNEEVFVPEQASMDRGTIQLDARLKEYFESQQQFPCHIKRRGRGGVSVGGLGTIGFLPYALMPWKYDKSRSWGYVGEDLIGRRIFCRIERLNDKKTGGVKFIASADVHRCYKTKLRPGMPYGAFVLHINHSHALLELGGNFEWKSGSVLAVQHRSDFGYEEFKKIQKGQYIEVAFQCYHDGGIAICGKEGVDPSWYDVTWNGSEGEVLEFEVRATGDGKLPRLFYEDYQARLLVHKVQFGEDRRFVDLALRKLEDGSKLEACIVKYYPESGSMKIMLTAEQAELLLAKEKRVQFFIGEMYAEMEHGPELKRYTLIHKEKGVVAILEQEVEVKHITMEAQPLAEILGGPYMPKYQVWTNEDDAVAIASKYYDYLSMSDSKTIALGDPANKKNR